MKVSEIMTRQVHIARPEQSIQDVAKIMADIDAGFLPVGEGDRIQGTITDRDITVRAVAQGRGLDTPVREIMSSEVKTCLEDDDVEQVTRQMAELQVRRMPVVNPNGKLVGVLSLGDLALEDRFDVEVEEAISGISRPGGKHSQTGGAAS